MKMSFGLVTWVCGGDRVEISVEVLLGTVMPPLFSRESLMVTVFRSSYFISKTNFVPAFSFLSTVFKMAFLQVANYRNVLRIVLDKDTKVSKASWEARGRFKRTEGRKQKGYVHDVCGAVK